MNSSTSTSTLVPLSEEARRINTITAHMLVDYVSRYRQLDTNLVDALDAILLSTRLEHELEKASQPCRPGPDTVADLISLFKIVVESQTNAISRLLWIWLCYCVLLPLFVLQRLPIYVNKLYWFMVLFGRRVREVKSAKRAWDDLARALEDRAQQDLVLSQAEAEEVVNMICRIEYRERGLKLRRLFVL